MLPVRVKGRQSSGGLAAYLPILVQVLVYGGEGALEALAGPDEPLRGAAGILLAAGFEAQALAVDPLHHAALHEFVEDGAVRYVAAAALDQLHEGITTVLDGQHARFAAAVGIGGRHPAGQHPRRAVAAQHLSVLAGLRLARQAHDFLARQSGEDRGPGFELLAAAAQGELWIAQGHVHENPAGDLLELDTGHAVTHSDARYRPQDAHHQHHQGLVQYRLLQDSDYDPTPFPCHGYQAAASSRTDLFFLFGADGYTPPLEVVEVPACVWIFGITCPRINLGFKDQYAYARMRDRPRPA